MKLLIRDYLASLRERGELDAILPDLLSELGFTVYSRPKRGTQQRGVDIAAVGADDNGESKVFLFTVKSGDLKREDWDGTPQALRSSLNEILDVYVDNRIPRRYRELKVVVCIALGGDVHETVRESLTSYTAKNSSDRVSFDEWNGDKIAGLILSGILREEILSKPLRSSFQKAVAMVDEPEIAFEHFVRLLEGLRGAGTESPTAAVRSARQMNICLWILFVWARDIGNVEAPYRASELTLLNIWDLWRNYIGQRGSASRSLQGVIAEVVKLHLVISSEFLNRTVLPYVGVRHGISLAIRSRAGLDVNLALFEILGRLALNGLWIHWIGTRGKRKDQYEIGKAVVGFVHAGLALIQSNPGLMLPAADHQSTDVALFLLLWRISNVDATGIASWLQEMVARLIFTVSARGQYPSCTSDYGELADHPRGKSDEYFEEATAGSTLIPLLVAWLHALGSVDAVEALGRLTREKLRHTTMQLWLPDRESEDHLYLGDAAHGTELCNLPVSNGGIAVLQTIAEACRSRSALGELSAMKCGYWPIVMVACRHHQLPVPPGLWIDALAQPEAK